KTRSFLLTSLTIPTVAFSIPRARWSFPKGRAPWSRSWAGTITNGATAAGQPTWWRWSASWADGSESLPGTGYSSRMLNRRRRYRYLRYPATILFLRADGVLGRPNAGRLFDGWTRNPERVRAARVPGECQPWKAARREAEKRGPRSRSAPAENE